MSDIPVSSDETEQDPIMLNEAVPVASQDEMDHAIDVIEDGLVDAWEDALADVSYYLANYDVSHLVESMQLALQIHDKIEFLKQYHSSYLNREGEAS